LIVRIASVQVAPQRIEEIVSRYRESVRPVHQQSEGLLNGAQLLLLLPYLPVVDFCGHARTVQADPCVHLKPAGKVEGDTA
jgi:hypothetical protein